MSSEEKKDKIKDTWKKPQSGTSSVVGAWNNPQSGTNYIEKADKSSQSKKSTDATGLKAKIRELKK